MQPSVMAATCLLLAGGAAHTPAEPERAPCATELRLTGDDEPGTPMRVDGYLSRDGEPAAGVVLEVFQTDAEGYYRRGADGRELGRDAARLSGELCTDAGGRYRLWSVQPAVYPGGGPPAHVHIYAHVNGRRRDLTFAIHDACKRDDDTLVCTVEDEL